MKRVASLKKVHKRKLLFRRNVHEDTLSCAVTKYIGYVQCCDAREGKYIGHRLWHSNSEEVLNDKIDRYIKYMIERNSRDHYEYRSKAVKDEADFDSLPW